MNNWFAFVIVILAQTATLFVVESVWRARPHADLHDHSLLQALKAGALGGIPFGILFDSICGRYLGIFQYELSGMTFFITNAIISYGLAIATALRLSYATSINTVAVPMDKNKFLLYLFGVSVLMLFSPPATIMKTFLIGLMVMIIGEALERIIFGTAGPVSEVLMGRFKRPAISWISVVFVGLCYELANYFAPVWHWGQIGLTSQFAKTAIIIIFGYVVLMHASRIVGLISLYAIDLASRRH
jgi:hypothetical protein